MMLNADVVRTMFHKGDQRMLEVFKETVLDVDEPNPECPNIKKVVFDLVPADGSDPADYDFELSINDEDKGYLGFQALDLVFRGSATFGEEDSSRDVSFSAPLDKMRVEGQLVDEESPEILKLNKRAKKNAVKDFSLEIGNVNFEDTSLPAACADEVRQGLKNAVMTVYDSIWEGNLDYLSFLPIESFLPMLFTRQLNGVAWESKFAPTGLEFGFDPEMLFESTRKLSKKKAEMLKEINSEFST